MIGLWGTLTQIHASKPGTEKTRPMMTPPPCHRLRPDKWEGIGSDGRMGLVCSFTLTQI